MFHPCVRVIIYHYIGISFADARGRTHVSPKTLYSSHLLYLFMISFYGHRYLRVTIWSPLCHPKTIRITLFYTSDILFLMWKFFFLRKYLNLMSSYNGCIIKIIIMTCQMCKQMTQWKKFYRSIFTILLNINITSCANCYRHVR